MKTNWRNIWYLYSFLYSHNVVFVDNALLYKFDVVVLLAQ